MSQATYILVTGANQGVGHTVVKQLLERVDNVVVYAAARSQTKAEESARLLNASSKRNVSNRAEPIVIDLTNDESIAKAAQGIPHLDVLVNNAAVSNLSQHDFHADAGDLLSLQAQRAMFRSVYETNVFGPTALINAFLPHLRRSTQSKRSIVPTIVNVSSGAGSISKFAASPTMQPTPLGRPSHYYASSKTALNVFTLFYSKLVPDIRVVSVSPGFTKTALNNFTGTESVETGASYVRDVILDDSIPTATFLGSGKRVEW